ncbi:MAG: glycosyltransferase family 39 protein [Planctomycetaceae bacterium]|nr:glycosyltransferase family 39 protein [Planctomycetaceae bacterium]
MLKEYGLPAADFFPGARVVLIPVSLLGALVCFFWAREFGGRFAGVLAVALWCFDPNILAWGATITPDVGAAAFGVLAAYLFSRWLRNPCPRTVLWAGVGLGLAELTKATWIILFAVWPLVWFVWDRAFGKRTEPIGSATHSDAGQAQQDGPVESSSYPAAKRPTARQLAMILILGLYLLNLGYGFEGTGQLLGDFTFYSKTLGGDQPESAGGNRFRNSVLRYVPVPVPANYLCGIDLQKKDFEQNRWSYLRGEHRRGGWWYYYLYAFLVKTPLGFVLLYVTAVVAGCLNIVRRWLPPLDRGPHGGAGDEPLSRGSRSMPRESERPVDAESNLFTVAIPGIAVFVLVSSQTGINAYFRYALPALPFLMICTAVMTTRLIRSDRRSLSAKCRMWPAVGLVVCGIAESLAVFPYSMSFFNLAVGGPMNGRFHLLDSNIDWGQDVLEFRQWVTEHPEARPLFADLSGPLPLKMLGIDARPLVSHPRPVTRVLTAEPRLQPGWYAVSVNHLMEYCRQESPYSSGCEYLRELQPVVTIGYSIYIYHVRE